MLFRKLQNRFEFASLGGEQIWAQDYSLRVVNRSGSQSCGHAPSLQAEEYLKRERSSLQPAARYPLVQVAEDLTLRHECTYSRTLSLMQGSAERNIMEEVEGALATPLQPTTSSPPVEVQDQEDVSGWGLRV